VTVGIETAPRAISIEGRTIRKLKVRILPFVWLLYIVAFLDRINIGFAALTMNRELAITSQQFGFVAGIFFVSYSICEIPSNLLLHKIGARIWLARILLTWGILATLTGFVHSVHQLYAMRFLLGLARGAISREFFFTLLIGFGSASRLRRLRFLSREYRWRTFWERRSLA
jgi:ACS family tartrate transporter-like MFS transporter